MPPRLSMFNVRKSFDGTVALSNVSLAIAPGEVHALLGENGAGKSTLMKVLSGVHQPDDGRMELNGRAFAPSDPHQARQQGIAMIYQELNLAPHLNAEENILLGCEPRRFGWIDRKKRRRLAESALTELGHENIPLDVPALELPIAQQQMVEIARALIGEPQVIVMDEPTSSLTQVDTESLFKVIRLLKQRGVSVVYISHFLEECQRIADRFTVLRDGEVAGQGPMAGTELAQIIRMMAGRDVSDIYPRRPHALGETALELRQLSGKGRPRSASLTLRKGEILGVAGLIGAGRTETLRACFGLDQVVGGAIHVRGCESTHRSPGRRLREGLGMVSENRKEEGLMLERSIAENLTLSRLSPYTKAGFVHRGRQMTSSREWMEKMGVKARHPHQRIGELSGGNQQKVAIGRLLHQGAEILLLDEPTRGIDVSSKAQIYHLIQDLACEGKSVIFVSSYLPELLGVCDTIAVMRRGVLSEARPAVDWTEHSIIEAAVGRGEEEVGA